MSASINSLAFDIRKKSAQMIARAQGSHIGGVFSCADILACVYGKVLSRTDNKILEPFILSKGHCCAGVYAALNSIGLISDEDLIAYAQDGSPFMAHISHKVPHVEFSTGSLGHGLPFAVGKAITRRNQAQNNNVYCLLSDGELDEGSNWEALMFAGFHRLSNLTAIIDYNKLQSLTSTYLTLDLEPLAEKFQAFNWTCIRCDGHSVDSLIAAFKAESFGRPKIILADTIKGYPVSFMMNKVEWHYKPPSKSQLAEILSELEAAVK
jgi:transketolase